MWMSFCFFGPRVSESLHCKYEVGTLGQYVLSMVRILRGRFIFQLINERNVKPLLGCDVQFVFQKENTCKTDFMFIKFLTVLIKKSKHVPCCYEDDL